MSLVSDFVLIVTSGTGATIITIAANAAASRRAARQADRERALTLFTQITTALAAIEAEKAVFRQRRDGWRPNMLAVAEVITGLLAARHDGSWQSGMAPGIASLRRWDASEGARFTDRLQAVFAQVNPALITLSLLSPQLQDACAAMTDAIGAAADARGRRHVTQAHADLHRALRDLRAAVNAFAKPPGRYRLRRKRSEPGQDAARSAIQP